jgi:glycosyltransferase involved in cell wall biosynthesis
MIGNGGDHGSQRNFNILRDLFDLENIEIFDVYPNLYEESKWRKFLGLYGLFRGYFFGITREKLEKIELLSRDKQIVFIDRSTFGYIAKYLKKQGFEGKIITFFHNVEKRFYEDYISKFNPFKKSIVKCAAKNEADAMLYSDLVLALNRRDDALLLQYYHRKADALVPVSFTDKKPQQTMEKIRATPVGLFVGSYIPMNVDGVLWFVKNVLPHVDMQLQIIGKGMSRLESKIKASASSVTNQKTKIISDVVDLSPYFEQADFVVLPIFKGSGMKVKTCEALMYGKHILGTQEAFEGYDVDFDKVGALVNSKEQFIQAIQELPNKFDSRFNSYSQNYFSENHSDETAKQTVEKLLFG